MLKISEFPHEYMMLESGLKADSSPSATVGSKAALNVLHEVFQFYY